MLRVLVLLLAALAGCGGEVVPSAQSAVHVEDTGSAVVVRSTAATVRVDKGTAALTLSDAAGGTLTQSAAPPTLMVGDTAQPLLRVRSVQPIMNGVELTCDAGSGSVQWTITFLTPRSVATRLRPDAATTVTRVVTALQAASGEHFYGLAERIVDAPSASISDRQASEIVPQAVGSLDRRGETITMEVMPTMSVYTPFFDSSRGYGVYVEGTMPGRYDLAQSDPNTVVIDFEFDQRTGEYGVVYFVGGHDTVLDEYTALTGRPFTPPRWGFRHLRWRDQHDIGTPAQLDGVDMNAELVEDVTMYETLGIPVGNYEFDRPWTSGTTDRGQPGFTSFDFDPIRFPNSDAMLGALQRRGYHIFVFGAPWALGDNAVDAAQFGYYAPRNNILIDFTNPAAVAWWTQRLQTLIDRGITGLKLDRGELESTVTELVNVPDRATDIFADGRNGREMKNDYARLFAQVHYDAFAARLGGNFLHYLRAGYAGSQQYGIFWGGDTPGTTNFGFGQPTDLGLRSAILSLARVAFMGFPIWGTDTGGYYQFGDREVFARWLELSALCPLMEIGGGGAHAPWNMPTQPAYDPDMIDIYRTYVTLHHELLPLIYSLALETHASGHPIARPLIFDYPNDPNAADLWDEFLLGHDLLVAPVWHTGDRSRTVYVPQGTWIDYWDPGSRVQGPQMVTAKAPLDRLPMYVRAGGILPLEVSSAVTGNGTAASAGRLTIDGYPMGVSSFVLREDEGTSTFILSDAPCGGASCVTLSVSPSRRGYVVRLLLDSVRSVTVNGQPLTSAASLATLDLVTNGWFFDASAGRLWAKFSTDGILTRLVAIR